MNFEQYISEADPVNKWVFNMNYIKYSDSDDEYSPVTRRALTYTMDDGRVIWVGSKGNGGLVYTIHINIIDRGVKSLIGFPFHMDEKPYNDYKTFRLWLTRCVETSKYNIHTYSLPTEDQFNELIQPSLSV